jgi:hypothetical protein
MNLESIEKRAQEINNSIIQLTAQLNALHGHLAECDYWKAEIAKLNEAVMDTADMTKSGMYFSETPASEEVDAQ